MGDAKKDRIVGWDAGLHPNCGCVLVSVDELRNDLRPAVWFNHSTAMPYRARIAPKIAPKWRDAKKRQDDRV